MNKALKFLCVTVLLSSCAAVAVDETAQTVEAKPSLVDRVQAQVVEVERAATRALPDEIAGLKSTEPVAEAAAVAEKIRKEAEVAAVSPGRVGQSVFLPKSFFNSADYDRLPVLTVARAKSKE